MLFGQTLQGRRIPQCFIIPFGGMRCSYFLIGKLKRIYLVIRTPAALTKLPFEMRSCDISKCLIFSKKNISKKITAPSIDILRISRDLVYPFQASNIETLLLRPMKNRHTLPQTNIAPENRPSQKETSIPTIHFPGLC